MSFKLFFFFLTAVTQRCPVSSLLKVCSPSAGLLFMILQIFREGLSGDLSQLLVQGLVISGLLASGPYPHTSVRPPRCGHFSALFGPFSPRHMSLGGSNLPILVRTITFLKRAFPPCDPGSPASPEAHLPPLISLCCL